MARRTARTSREEAGTPVDLVERTVGCRGPSRRRRRRPTPAPERGHSTDLSVRRVVNGDVRVVRRVLLRRLESWGSAAGLGEYRFAGVVRAGRWHHPVPVDLVVAPWSVGRTELRIEVRDLRMPSGYFDAAHDVADELAGHVADALTRR